MENRPSAATSPTPTPSSTPPRTPMARPAATGGMPPFGAPWFVAGVAIVVAIVVILGTWVTNSGFFASQPSVATSSNSWAAVFMADNEVFFGHPKLVNDKEIELTDVYYLQRSSAPATAPGASTQQQQSQQFLSLVNLTSGQIQCPKDDMVVDRNYVLYYQELNPASYVVNKITTTLQSQPHNCYAPSSQSPQASASAAPSATP